MNIRNIVFDSRGDMIAFVNKKTGIQLCEVGITVMFEIDVNLIIDFI